MLLCHDVRVVGGLYSSSQRKPKRDILILAIVDDADLMVAVVEASKVVAHLCVVFLKETYDLRR